MAKRRQTYRNPDLSAAVAVAEEREIQILYADKYGVSFVPKGGGHGAMNSLRTIQDSVELSLMGFDYVNISSAGDYAVMGGGVKAKTSTTNVWAVGKYTVTGQCECVGAAGVMLGEGHGLLQGQYGLLADQLIEARLVLANGPALAMSNSSLSDLFWAL